MSKVMDSKQGNRIGRMFHGTTMVLSAEEDKQTPAAANLYLSGGVESGGQASSRTTTAECLIDNDENISNKRAAAQFQQDGRESRRPIFSEKTKHSQHNLHGLKRRTRSRINPEKPSSFVRLILLLLITSELFNQLINELFLVVDKNRAPELDHRYLRLVCQLEENRIDEQQIERSSCLKSCQNDERTSLSINSLLFEQEVSFNERERRRRRIAPPCSSWFSHSSPLYKSSKLSVLSLAMQIVRPILAATPNDNLSNTTATERANETLAQVLVEQQKRQTKTGGQNKLEATTEAEATNLSSSSSSLSTTELQQQQQQPSTSPSSSLPATTTTTEANFPLAASVLVGGGRNGNESVGSATDAAGANGRTETETTLSFQAHPGNSAESITATATNDGGASSGQTETETTETTATTTAETSSTRKPILSLLALFGGGNDSDNNDNRLPSAAKTTTKTIEQKSTTDGNTKGSGEQRNELERIESTATTARAMPANQQQSSSSSGLQSANRIVCNSRCKCLIVELLAAANQMQSSSSSQQQDSGQETADKARQEDSLVAVAESTTGKQPDKTLSSFEDDYSLDDDYEQSAAASTSSLSVSPTGIGHVVPATTTNFITDFEPQHFEQPPEQQQTVSLSKIGDKFHHPNQLSASTMDNNNNEYSVAKPLLYPPHLKQLYSNPRFQLPHFQQPARSAPTTTGEQSPPLGPSSGGANSDDNYPAVFHHQPQQQHNRMHSLRAQAAAKPQSRSHHLHEHHHHQQYQIKQILPLSSLDLSNGRLNETADDGDERQMVLLSEKLVNLLDSIERNKIQSLVLRNNDLKFEFLTQLYALISLPMRQNLFHLDLSHNSLVKLGVTFTGYIEHQLANHNHQQAENTTNWWPFNHSNNTNYSSSFHQQQQQQQQVDNDDEMSSISGNRLKTFASNGGTSGVNGGGKQRLRLHPILGDGRIFNLVINRRLQQTRNNSSLLLNQYFNATQLHQTTLIRALDLSHNKLKWLINDQFRALKHVQSLRLDSNKIRFIHQQAFNGLESLKYINLNSNRIQTIYVEQFQTNYNLLALMLRSNYLAYLRAGSFASQSNLKRLDLSRNKFTILSNNAFVGLESLELLNLSSNQFVHVPSSSLHPMTSLARLDLSNNQLAQLVPGTFFHLTIEELSLNDNEQLVIIDRGAFWDLPYLRHLNLSSNPMLANINSQAFVGTQNLQFIHVDDCQSLDSSTRQMLENITMATTSRQLRIEQQQQNDIKTEQSSLATSIVASNESNAEQSKVSPSPPPVALQIADNKQQLQQRQEKLQIAVNQQQQQQPNYWKYAHSIVLITLFVVALKLVYKFTAARSYLEARRRARRVYQASSSSDCSSSDCSDSIDDEELNCGNSNSIAMCEQQLGIHVIGLTTATTSSNNRATARRCSSSSSSSSSSPSTSPQPSPSCHTTNIELGEVAESLPNGDRVVDHGGGGGRLSSRNNNDAAIELNEANDFNNVIAQAQQQTIDGSTTTSYCPDCSHQQIPMEVITSQAELMNENGQLLGQANNTCCDQQPQPTTTTTTMIDQQQVVMDHNNLTKSPNANSNSQPTTTTLTEIIHNQLVEAGFDYGHANCLHFYQSLGPALQFADMTANYVNQMDYYS